MHSVLRQQTPKWVSSMDSVFTGHGMTTPSILMIFFFTRINQRSFDLSLKPVRPWGIRHNLVGRNRENKATHDAKGGGDNFCRVKGRKRQ